MKMTMLFLVIFNSILVFNQDTKSSKYNYHSATLCAGDTMRFGDKEIKFKKVISDSRCPAGDAVTCIWAGEVTVLVEFYEDGKLKGEKVVAGTNRLMGETEILASAAISLSEFSKVSDLSISGVKVLPYPRGRVKISPEEYSLNLKISEKVEAN
ncbi:hypothetical protein [Gramella sp. MAR_2010_147]|uniref:hypothetical protein n=1 Tax=Gramella sp. MAR_2010_147 TaxID=1250205 RepID=UPI00087C806B|nr:hypothetical protein [Gramella sp. MAR_2010_147]SDS41859.1 hypothetical protein SAMN04488553_2212 [Gramella sp. MAR_2010_147]